VVSAISSVVEEVKINDFTQDSLIFSGRRGPQKAEDLVHELQVNLEDLYKGKTSKMAVSRDVLCTGCKGLVLHFTILQMFFNKSKEMEQRMEVLQLNVKPVRDVVSVWLFDNWDLE
jgi:hypothetical protein